MDTSEEFVEMCEKAEEIQREMAIPCCEAYLLDSSRNLRVYGGEFTIISKKNTVWLPRQDQLQEMIDRNGGTNFLLCRKLVGAFRIGETIYIAQTIGDFSMEQIWLVYIMKEKYNKIWDGRNWKEEK